MHATQPQGGACPEPTSSEPVLFGTVTAALFPAPSRRNGDTEILAATGMETLEIVSRLNRSDVDAAVCFCGGGRDRYRWSAQPLCGGGT